MVTSSTSRSSIVHSYDFAPPDEHVKLRSTVLMATLVACLGSISFGFVLGYAPAVYEELRRKLHLDNATMSWFGGVFVFSAMAAVSYLGIYAVGNFGRKVTIMLCSVPFTVGWVIIAGAKSDVMLYLGRIITGLAVGVISLTVPVYIAEISPAKHRGALIGCHQLSIMVGYFIAFILELLFNNWRWLAIAGAVPPTLMVVLMTAMPETPHWLIINDRIPEAIRILEWLGRGSREENEEECRNIKNTLGITTAVSLKEITNPSVFRPLILSVLLMAFQQFCGSSPITTYLSKVVLDTGFPNPRPFLIFIAAVQFVASVISCLIVDKLGRRLLLIFTGILMSISMFILGLCKQFPRCPYLVALISLSLYLIGFYIAWGPIPWLVMSEVFPARVRGIACGVATQVLWISGVLAVAPFRSIIDALGFEGAYWLYGTSCLFSAIFVFFFFPETKGRTLEEIEDLLSDRRGLLLMPSCTTVPNNF